MATRVAALYDIHGNLPTLFDAVLAEVREARADRIVVGGDVLPGPMPRETLERLLALDIAIEFIRGNGDREVIAPSGQVPVVYMPSIRWNAEQLSPEHAVLIAGWPLTCRVQVDGIGDVPSSTTDAAQPHPEIFTRRTPDEALRPIFGSLGVSLVVCGHTHMQFDRTVGEVRIVNAGSIGLPFGASGAFWLLLGPDVQLPGAPPTISTGPSRRSRRQPIPVRPRPQPASFSRRPSSRFSTHSRPRN